MKMPDLARTLAAPLSDLHSNEQVKHDSNFLRGTLNDSLADVATGAISDTDTLLTKFFGIYQQDDRDLRDERRRAKLEPRYQFMVRVRLPGGVCTPAQWLALDSLARQYAGNTLRLTTRQTFQFHEIRKQNLRPLIEGLRRAGLDTVAACGDDNRNVICTANPLHSAAHAEVSTLAQTISRRLMPRTGAYREVFLGKHGEPLDVEEPLYGRTYLPRKFKIAIAVPPRNDVDVYAHDLGFVAILEAGEIVGYNVLVGGGMGMTHKQPATFPRLGDVIGFCRKEDVPAVAEQAMCIQRDFGDRKDRSHARFKYTIEDFGVEWFLAELARRLGHALEPAREFQFTSTGDASGWERAPDGRWNYTVQIQNGRVNDREGRALMSGLRSIATSHSGLFALTTNQNVILAGVLDRDRAGIERLLRDYGIVDSPRGVRQNALACVAFPTCGLAMAESERYMPEFLDKLAGLMRAAGVEDAPITVRMSGCPNGCSRPYLAEIALVGKAPGKYNLYLGASVRGDRLNALFRENVNQQEILAALEPVIQRYAAERTPAEPFGDFAIRAGFVREMRHGRDFQSVSSQPPGA
jgi:sulfite reductase (NADPH) hemoprotein beta-component